MPKGRAAASAPGATQVADRFHLLRNLVDALAAVLEREPEALRHAVASTPAVSPLLTTRQAARAARVRTDYARVHELRAAGMPVAVIARVTGISRQRVYRYLRAPTCPEHARPGPRGPRALRALRGWLAVLEAEWQAGCTQALALYHRLRARGCPASRCSVWRWVVARRAHDPPRDWRTRPEVQHASAMQAAVGAGTLLGQRGRALLRTPSPRRAAWLLLHASDAGDAPEARDTAALARALDVVAPRLAEAAALARDFRQMVRTRAVEPLEPWLARAQMSALRSFAKGVARDAAAAALTSAWSNGQTEGQVTRLKLVKRTMYGRAGFPLLRARLLASA